MKFVIKIWKTTNLTSVSDAFKLKFMFVMFSIGFDAGSKALPPVSDCSVNYALIQCLPDALT